MKDEIEIYNINKDIEDILTGWDKLKTKIKNAAIRTSKLLNHKEKEDLEKLQEELLHLKKIEEEQHIDLRDNINDTRFKIINIEDRKIEGNRIRAKKEKITYDERPTKYYYKKEKSFGQKQQITILLNENDEEIESKNQILEEVRRFYRKLYETEGCNQDVAEDNLSHVKKKLSHETAQKLNCAITEKEVVTALEQQKMEKSPGEDGLTAEFYMEFRELLVPELATLYNSIMVAGEAPLTMRNAIIKLLYKKNDHRHLKNWRPISLLNLDYKLLTKILTNRLTPYLENIVPMEQKCGVDGRRMRDVIRNLDSYRDESAEGFLVCIDQEKAFDRVNHDYLFKTLETFGINGNFLKITKTLYHNITSQVMINGSPTNKIPIKRGVRQGCPYSMLLFVLCSVPLIEMINDDRKITGHKTKKGNSIKIQAYADDNTVIIKKPIELDHIIKTYKKHGQASEAKINEDKTQILPIGDKIRSMGTPSFEEKIVKKKKYSERPFVWRKTKKQKKT